jgi:hypothetical protein
MKPAQQVRVVIQLVGGPQHLLKVMAAIARRCFFLGPLTDDAQFFPAQFGNFGQNLFQIHRFPFPGHPAAFLGIRLAEQRCPAQDHLRPRWDHRLHRACHERDRQRAPA